METVSKGAFGLYNKAAREFVAAAKQRRKRALPAYARHSATGLCTMLVAVTSAQSHDYPLLLSRWMITGLLILSALTALVRLCETLIVTLESPSLPYRALRLLGLFSLLPNILLAVWAFTFLVGRSDPWLTRVALLVWLNYFAVGCAVALRRGVDGLVRSRKARI